MIKNSNHIGPKIHQNIDNHNIMQKPNTGSLFSLDSPPCSPQESYSTLNFILPQASAAVVISHCNAVVKDLYQLTQSWARANFFRQSLTMSLNNFDFKSLYNNVTLLANYKHQLSPKTVSDCSSIQLEYKKAAQSSEASLGLRQFMQNTHQQFLKIQKSAQTMKEISCTKITDVKIVNPSQGGCALNLLKKYLMVIGNKNQGGSLCTSFQSPTNSLDRKNDINFEKTEIKNVLKPNKFDSGVSLDEEVLERTEHRPSNLKGIDLELLEILKDLLNQKSEVELSNHE